MGDTTTDGADAQKGGTVGVGGEGAGCVGRRSRDEGGRGAGW